MLYEKRRPPTASTDIAEYVYLGPPLAACGNPVLTFSDSDSTSLAFLSYAFTTAGDGTSKITIKITDASKAVKGEYDV